MRTTDLDKAAIITTSVAYPSDVVGLSFLWLELTASCNLTCQHCYTESSPQRPLLGKMSVQDWVSVMQQARAMDCRAIQFIGGEPTLHPNFSSLVSEAARIGFQYIEVYSNGTRIDQAMAHRFKELGVCVALSVYSSDPVVHDRVTRRPGSYLLTLQAIRHLTEAGVVVRVSVVEFDALNPQFEGVVAVLDPLGVTDVRSDVVRKVGRGGECTGDVEAELCGGCWSRRLCVTTDGLTYPCVFSRHLPLGDVRAGLDAIVSSDALLQFRVTHKALTEKRGDTEEVGCGKGCRPECVPGLPCRPNVGPCNPECSPNAKPCNPDCSPQNNPLEPCCPDRPNCTPDQCNPNLA